MIATVGLPLALCPQIVRAETSSPSTPAQYESAVRFGLPALFTGYRTTCASQLDADGYTAVNADRLTEKFSDGADAHWPAAKSVLFTLGGEHGVEHEMLSEIPDDALKPFVYALLEQIAATEIKPDNCADVERGLELLDPLPADNIAGLIGFIMELTGKDDAGAAQTLGGN